jgi:hypothetical protein
VGAAQPLTQFAGATGVSVAVKTDNPLEGMLSSQEAVDLQVVIAVIASIVVALLSLLYWLCGNSWRSAFRSLDRFYDFDHYVADGESEVKRPQAIGGIFTIIAISCMLAVSILATVEYVLVPVYTQGVSPHAPPFRPSGQFNVSVRLIGSAASCKSAPTILPPAAADIVGAWTTGFQPLPSTCEMFWACQHCVFATSAFAVSFLVDEADSFAAGIEYSIHFPGFIGSSASKPSSPDDAPSPFTLSSALFPPQALKSVFRGSATSAIAVSLVPVVFKSSVGSFAHLVSGLPGSAVNESTYTTASNGVSVRFQITSTPYVFDVQPTPRFQLQLLAQIASLLGTILVACKVAMNLVESFDRNNFWMLPQASVPKMLSLQCVLRRTQLYLSCVHGTFRGARAQLTRFL